MSAWEHPTLGLADGMESRQAFIGATKSGSQRQIRCRRKSLARSVPVSISWLTDESIEFLRAGLFQSVR
jgi:hypothetical protein